MRMAAEEAQVLAVPPGVPVVEAATMSVNMCSAYRMLRDFITLKPGKLTCEMTVIDA